MIIARITPPFMVAGLLAVSQLREGIGPPAWVLGASLALAYVVPLTGRIAGVTAPLAEWAAGIVVASVGVLLLVLVLRIPAAWAFALWACAALALRLRFAARLRSAPAAPRDLVALAACVALTAAWCIAPDSAMETLERARVLPVWADHFFHGGMISQFGDARASGAGSVYLAGAPRPLYHYASYMLPAALAAVLDQPGLPLAIALWMPLGLLAMLAAAYALGDALGGRAGGIAALGALALLPDASTYLLRSGPVSFHWLLFASPGNAYALTAAFLSALFLHRWSATRSSRALAASALFACAMLPLRVHLFLLFAPAWLATLAWCSEKRAKRVTVLLGVYVAGALAAILIPLALQSRPGEPPWWLQGSAVAALLEAVHLRIPSGYYEWYIGLHERYSRALVYPVGVLLMYPAALGLLLLALPAAALAAWRRGLLVPIDALPFFIAAVYGLFMAAAPPAFTDAGEFNYKPVILMYAAFALWTAAIAARLVRRYESHIWLALTLVVFAGAVALWPEARARTSPTFDWAWVYARHRPQPGVVEAGHYLRRHAVPGERFAVTGLKRGYAAMDAATELVGLTGVPAYLARPFVFLGRGGEAGELAEKRLDALSRIERAADAAAALRLMREEGIGWLVAVGEAGPAWDPDRKQAEFSAGNAAVYRVR